MPHRFFIPADWLTLPTVQLYGDIARQLKTVLRLQPGDEIIVLDNSGQEWPVRLTRLSADTAQGDALISRPAPGEPTLHVTLYQGALKADKFEWVLQKATELGVSRFVPTLCHRSVVNRAEDLTRKYPRWERIIREAAEQSRRGRLPTLESPLPLAQAIQQMAQSPSPGNLRLIAWEETTEPSLKTVLAGANPQTVALFIGPEGGFTAAEAQLAQESGLQPVTLGPRILRAETAAIAVCAAIFYQAGQWA
jgi:16S rRNA (uracil1498-N3)-methyltransferase